ncbi:hypothetical protein IV203_033192 [Nitzschia inconspicua]|uniref:Uncharacterized protein n=1 Tax=Nitzschia inconspicua TaxID=303405 RepID=A0A9K3KLP2_9STRA|nr:hypothetical protein IV203_033192 [Nitzschia inconspicua]
MPLSSGDGSGRMAAQSFGREAWDARDAAATEGFLECREGWGEEGSMGKGNQVGRAGPMINGSSCSFGRMRELNVPQAASGVAGASEKEIVVKVDGDLGLGKRDGTPGITEGGDSNQGLGS